MAHLRCYLNLNIVYLGVYFVNIALTIYIVYFTFVEGVVVVLTNNLIDFLMILPISALALLISDNWDVGDAVEVVLRIQLIQIFKFVSAWPK
jgi:hypothetical protein